MRSEKACHRMVTGSERHEETPLGTARRVAHRCPTRSRKWDSVLSNTRGQGPSSTAPFRCYGAFRMLPRRKSRLRRLKGIDLNGIIVGRLRLFAA